jgi:hypothetical protein
MIDDRIGTVTGSPDDVVKPRLSNLDHTILTGRM